MRMLFIEIHQRIILSITPNGVDCILCIQWDPLSLDIASVAISVHINHPWDAFSILQVWHWWAQCMLLEVKGSWK